MQTFIKRLDELAATTGAAPPMAQWLERGAFVFLILMVVSAPHSIAATQTAWLTGMFLWVARLFAPPRPALRFGALDVALWAFFGWSILTSLTSYAPDISIDKLRGASVFLIFYFVFYNVRTRKTANLLALVLVGSCMMNVLWVPIERLIGRGVEIHGLASNSPLARAHLRNGDTLLTADGMKLRTPDDVVAAIERNEATRIKFYRPDFEFVVEVNRADLIGGTDPMSRLGIESWKKSRNWRSSGFYGHYATYSEVLQLIGSLVLGLFVAQLRLRISRSPRLPLSASPRPWVAASLLLSLVAISFALLLTVTRASQLAFLISAAVIVLVGLGRKWLLAAAVIGLPLALIGLFFLQQSRQVGFFDRQDESIRWRQTVWTEAVDLWTSSPRNFLLGVGMDSIKRFGADWKLFDDGRLPVGHFHSTPLNLVVERGLPALLLWLTVLGVYARALWRGLNPTSKIQNPKSIGVFLGCLGGMIGFFISGLVHYNLGDQEVAMVFYLLMGLGIRVAADDDPSVDS